MCAYLVALAQVLPGCKTLQSLRLVGSATVNRDLHLYVQHRASKLGSSAAQLLCNRAAGV